MKWFSYLVDVIFNIVFPVTCVVCGTVGDDLCPNCLDRFPAPENDTPDWVTVSYSYKHSGMRDVILHLKRYPNHRLTDILARRIFSDPHHLTPSTLSIERDDNADNLLIIPVPVTKTRFYERGFNQAEIITNSLMQYFPDAQICTDTVIKLDTAVKQSMASSKQQRIQNADHVFHIIKPDHIVGCDIIIVDDVITSGATLSSLRDELLHAGARSVRAITLGH